MGLNASLDYSDKILATITVSLSSGALAGAITDFSLRVGRLAGALVATTFIHHAMFRNPPRPVASPRAKAAAIVWHLFLVSLLVTASL